MKKILLIFVSIFAILSISCNNTGPDPEPITVTITSPEDSQEFLKGDIVTISATVNEKSDLYFVAFFIDDVDMGCDFEPPYEYQWDTEIAKNSDHSIYVEAWDMKDNTGTSNVIHVTLITSITDIDGNQYNIIKVGSQYWLKENLIVTHYRNGDSIPIVTVDEDWIVQSDGAWCSYNNSSMFDKVYGHLYNWFTVKDDRGLAPEGWHVATLNEWQVLIEFLGGDGVAGGKLKEVGNTHWNIPNTGATNESGFTALPGGYRSTYYDGEFFHLGYNAHFWMLQESSDMYAEYIHLHYDFPNVFISNEDKRDGFSVRCIKNQEN
ncbi:MAG: hypothetical protein JW794_01255 [Candidatus Cloacimonetes bacterium]|nr:hypothetical protein [Candidatus Cloacimonadota bacterium]